MFVLICSKSHGILDWWILNYIVFAISWIIENFLYISHINCVHPFSFFFRVSCHQTRTLMDSFFFDKKIIFMTTSNKILINSPMIEWEVYQRACSVSKGFFPGLNYLLLLAFDARDNTDLFLVWFWETGKNNKWLSCPCNFKSWTSYVRNMTLHGDLKKIIKSCDKLNAYQTN
jgi:hypothetical protein